MIDGRDISSKNRALQNQLEAKLGVRSRNLGHGLKRAGRRLPRKVHKQGMVLLDAEKMAANPKLARQMNPKPVDRAYAEITSHLDAIDVADARKGWWLSLAGVIAGNLLLIIAAFVTWLWWIDYV